MQWFGFLWQRVTGPHGSLSECSRALECIARERGIAARHQVMTGGSVPNFKPAGKRSARPAAPVAVEDP